MISVQTSTVIVRKILHAIDAVPLNVATVCDIIPKFGCKIL